MVVMVPPPEPSFPSTLGRYELVAPLSQGGMGELFLARLAGVAGWHKQVAIKRLLPHLAGDGEFLERFIDEARIAVSLTHGNIVPLFELAEDAGALFIAMEYIDGWDLRQLMRQRPRGERRVPLPAALYIAIEVCKGLAYAHSRTDAAGNPLHIVHRDISPANLIVSRQGEVKIVDFGIASARSRLGNTQTGQVRGKLAYMSPEQASGRTVDNRSDLFSLGVVLYEMIAGRRPFDANADHELLARIQSGVFPRLQDVASDVPDEVAAVVHRALAVDVADRFASAEELQIALMQAMQHLSGPFTAQQLARWAVSVGVDAPSHRRDGLDGVLNEELDRLLGGGGLTPSAGRSVTPSPLTPSAVIRSRPTGTPVVPAPSAVATSQSGEVPVRTAALPSPGDVTRTAAVVSPSPVVPPPEAKAGSRGSRLWPRAVAGVLVVASAALAFTLWPTPGVVLEVTTEPSGATVFVDGTAMGVSTLRTEFAPGEHFVRVQLAGFESSERSIVLERDADEAALTFALEPLPQRVEFESFPAGALVQVEGYDSFVAGNSIELPVGARLRVTMSQDGYVTWSEELEFAAGRTRVSARLEPVLNGSSPGVLDGAPLEDAVDPERSVREGDSTGRELATSPPPMELRRYLLPSFPAGTVVEFAGRTIAPEQGLRVPSTDAPGRLRVSAPGFEVWEREIDPGTLLSGRLDVSLTPARGQGTLSLQFSEAPFVGDISVDGRVIGRWDRQPIELAAGRHTIVVTNATHGTEHRSTVEIEPDGEHTLAVEWQ
jgi:serine/threonine protein kinase